MLVNGEERAGEQRGVGGVWHVSSEHEERRIVRRHEIPVINTKAFINESCLRYA